MVDSSLHRGDLRDTCGPCGGENERLMVEFAVAVVARTLISTGNAHVEDTARLGERTVEGACHDADALVASLVARHLHGVSLREEAGGDEIAEIGVLEHHAEQTRVV